jgi:2-oxoglutarate dehydrogenase E2 component (dihydrolipoamide succinyltransferase)
MPLAVTLPELGDSVTDATISRWLRFPGDLIEKNDPLVEVSTDKIDTEVGAPASGRLTELLAQEGDVVLIGANLALIDEMEPPQDNTGRQPGSATNEVHAPTMELHKGGAGDAAPYVTPLVRRLATELGVDLAKVKGSGLGQRIRKSDVLAAAPRTHTTADSKHHTAVSSAHSPTNSYVSPLIRMILEERGLDASELSGSGHRGRIRLIDLGSTRHRSSAGTPRRPDRREKMTPLRSVIAERMVESLQKSAQLTTVVEADVTAVSELRAQYGPRFSAAQGVKLSFTSFFVRAAIDALADFPALNASVDTATQTVTYYGAIDLNLAIDTDRGLLAPVIRNADRLDIARIACAVHDLADRARTNSLKPDDLKVGTFTITNTGSRGALFDTPIINQPQVAILGTGAVVARAEVLRDSEGNDTVDIRKMAYLALTYDHRLIDGADAARFLTAVKSRLEAAAYSQELATASGG